MKERISPGLCPDCIVCSPRSYFVSVPAAQNHKAKLAIDLLVVVKTATQRYPMGDFQPLDQTKATVLASTIVIILYLPFSVCQPFLVSSASILSLQLSHASVRFA